MIEQALELSLTSMPGSTLLVTLTAVIMNIIANTITRKFTDLKKFRRIRKEAQAYRAELKKAMLAGDKAKEARLKRKEKAMRQLEMKASWSRMKPMFAFWIPFIAVYWLLISFLGGINTIVAVSPAPIPLLVLTIGPELSIFWWYFISSLSFSGMISRLMGTTMD